MPKIANQQMPRHSVNYFEGVNSYSGDNLLRKSELSASQNVRVKTLGVLEKRAGFTRLGNDIGAGKNLGIHHFGHGRPALFGTENTLYNNHFLRISRVSNGINLYHLKNDTSIWEAASSGISLIGTATTTFNITASGSDGVYTYSGAGADPGDFRYKLNVGDTIRIASSDMSAANTGEFTVTQVNGSSFRVFNASAVVEAGKALTGGSLTVPTATYSFFTIDENAFMVNGSDLNAYYSIDSGLVTSDSVTGHLYNSPRAKKINFYKGRIYLGDYKVTSNRFKNGIIRSSEPLGIMALVDGDHAANATTIKVTDTKYFPSTDVNFQVDIFRGGIQISSGTLTLSSKTQTSIIVDANSATCLSADEIWASGTYNGSRRFMWPDATAGSTDAAIFDTFRLSGGENDSITMMTNIGDVMMISNKTNMGAWNNSNIQTFDGGIGCVSDRGYVRHSGVLYFVNYKGIYITSGAEPQLLSQAMSKYFDGATKSGLDGAVAWKKGQSVFFCIGTVTLYNEDGSTNKTLSGVCLEYMVPAKQWFVHTNVVADDMKTYVEASDPDRLIFSSSSGDGNVFEFLSGTSDNGSDIPIEITTGGILASSYFEDISYPKHVVTEMPAGSGLKVFVALDGESFYEAGEGNKGASIIKLRGRTQELPPPRARSMQLSFRESSNRALKLSAFAIEYAPVAEKESQR